MQKQTLVLSSNIYFLQQGIDLLSDITDTLYTTNNGEYNKSGIGRHFRHIIEHYFSFVNEDSGKIDYDARERNLRLENDRLFMISTMKEISESLNTMFQEPDKLDAEVLIRSNEGAEEENSPLSKSTFRRELQFLISHTVHHYALIGLILKTMGYNPDASFGVAPSTLRYEKEKSSEGIAS